MRERLGFLLLYIGRTLNTRVEALLSPLGLTAREFGILETLSREGPINQLAIARSRALDPAVIVAAIDGLEAKSFVERKVDPSDRRNRLVNLTASGNKVVEEAATVIDSAERSFLSGLPENEQEIFRRVLHRLYADAAEAPESASDMNIRRRRSADDGADEM